MGELKGMEKLIEVARNYFRASSISEASVILDKFCDYLKTGGVYDFDIQGLNKLETYLSRRRHPFGKELIMDHNDLLPTDAEKEYNQMLELNSNYFQDCIKYGKIITPEEQEKMISHSADQIFDRLFNHVTAYGLGIFPKYETTAMMEVEVEFCQAFERFTPVHGEEELDKLRIDLGAKADIMKLDSFSGEYYNYESEGTELEYKVSSITLLPEVRFFVVDVCGYYGILKFYPEEMARIAPEGANAFYPGNAVLRTVKYQGIASPIIGGKVLRDIKQKNGMYHIVPVRFFKVELDTSKKYNSEIEVLEQDEEGNATRWRYVVKERNEKATTKTNDK